MDLRVIGWVICGLDACGSVYGPVAGSCEHGNEPWDYIKGAVSVTS